MRPLPPCKGAFAPLWAHVLGRPRIYCIVPKKDGEPGAFRPYRAFLRRCARRAPAVDGKASFWCENTEERDDTPGACARIVSLAKKMRFYPEGYLLDTFENKTALGSPAALAEAMRDGKILEGRAVMCNSGHDLIVDLKCMKGIIPREEGALGIREGTVRDIAMISRVNRPVCFTVQDFVRGQDGRMTALLSRRAAQEKCRAAYIDCLSPGDVVEARVTHIEPFGVFADIGCGMVSLLPIDSISVSRIEHPRERFLPGMDIRAVVKSREGQRVTLTHKELLGTWEENAASFQAGETVGGVIRSIESYGVFVELAPNLAGLAEVKENIFPGQQASVFIKSILPSRMKIKLIIIETFEGPPAKPLPPRYFFMGDHMDEFVYSPENCEKHIVTRF